MDKCVHVAYSDQQGSTFVQVQIHSCCKPRPYLKALVCVPATKLVPTQPNLFIVLPVIYSSHYKSHPTAPLYIALSPPSFVSVSQFYTCHSSATCFISHIVSAAQRINNGRGHTVRSWDPGKAQHAVSRGPRVHARQASVRCTLTVQPG